MHLVLKNVAVSGYSARIIGITINSLKIGIFIANVMTKRWRSSLPCAVAQRKKKVEISV